MAQQLTKASFFIRAFWKFIIKNFNFINFLKCSNISQILPRSKIKGHYAKMKAISVTEGHIKRVCPWGCKQKCLSRATEIQGCQDNYKTARTWEVEVAVLLKPCLDHAPEKSHSLAWAFLLLHQLACGNHWEPIHSVHSAPSMTL